MKYSLTATQISFRHNDAESLRKNLVEIKESYPLIKSGTRCALIAVESVYSIASVALPSTP